MIISGWKFGVKTTKITGVTKMKKIILIALFAIFSIPTFAQVQGCQFIDTLAATQTKYFSCRSASEFAVLSITLSNANDTVIVSVGTGFRDSTAAQQEYGQIVVTDMYTGDEVSVITGNTTANRKYFIKWGYKQKYVRLVSSSNGATINYILEFY